MNQQPSVSNKKITSHLEFKPKWRRTNVETTSLHKHRGPYHVQTWPKYSAGHYKKLTFIISPRWTRSTLMVFSLVTFPALSIMINTASDACMDISLAKASDVFPCCIKIEICFNIHQGHLINQTILGLGIYLRLKDLALTI